MLKIIPQGAVFAAPHACLELHLVLYVFPESVLPSDTDFFLMGSKDYNSTSVTYSLVNRFGDSFQILTINQCSSQDFFYRAGGKDGGGGGGGWYIVMVHCFSQSVFIKPRNKKKEGKKRWERKRNKKEGTNDGGKNRKKRKKKKEGKKERKKVKSTKQREKEGGKKIE